MVLEPRMILALISDWFIVKPVYHGEDLCIAFQPMTVKAPVQSWAWWCMPVIPTLRRQRQAKLCEFKASLVSIVSSWPSRAT